jgi:nucleotide-binding universal stress UspA family protein
MRYVCTVENGRTIPIDVHRILVPIDFSDASEAALEYAIDLAARHSATVDVVHVIELPPYTAMAHYAGDTDAGIETFAQHMHELATEQLRDLISERSRDNVQLRGIVESGEPIKVIPRIAANYDLVVMGAHDDDAAKSLFFSNVGDRVPGDVRCTVISVRREEERAVRRELRESAPSRA